MNNITLYSANNLEKLSNVTPIRKPTSNPIPLIMLLVGSFGILPNLIIIIGVNFRKSLRKPTYYLLANLALCDLLLSLSTISNFIMDTLSRQNIISHKAHVTLCKILGIFPMYFSYSASIQTLIIISGERYHAIFRPASQLTAKKAKFFCAIAWIISLLISFPFIITATANKKLPKQCLAFTTYTTWTAIIYVIIFVFQFALPAIIMITLYSFILRQLKKNIPGRKESSRSKKLKRKTIYMLLTTTIIFLIFAAPWAVAVGITAIAGTVPIKIVLHPAYAGMMEMLIISRIMLPFTAIYNPIAYCIFNPHIRNLYVSCFRHLFCMKATVAPVIQANSKFVHASIANSNASKETKYLDLKPGAVAVSTASNSRPN